MSAPPTPWQIALARIEGALPFLPAVLADGLALASLRRIWRIHVRDFPFDTMGLEHNPGLESAELLRSWFAAERRDLLSWVSRRGGPPLARAARLALATKGESETFASAYGAADRALERLDTLLPARDPIRTLAALVEQLRTDEIEFLEGGSELREFAGTAFDRPAPRGAAWAASLAISVRPQLFSLGNAPLALAGLAPRALFRAPTEFPLPLLLSEAADAAARHIADDLTCLHSAQVSGAAALSKLYASSRAPDAWALLTALGPLTRAELARALCVTKRTASMAVSALERVDLARLRPHDKAVVPVNTGPLGLGHAQ